MGIEISKRLKISACIVRAGIILYAFYRSPFFKQGGSDFWTAVVFFLLYVVLTDSLFFLNNRAGVSLVFVLDSLFCAAFILFWNLSLLPILLLPGITAGFSLPRIFYFIWVNAFIQIGVFLLFHSSHTAFNSPAFRPLFSEIILVNAASIFLAYGVLQTLKESEQNKGLLDLIQIGQQMGSSLSYEKVSSLLMNVLISMFDAHTYGFYVLEERESEKMAVLRGIHSSYHQLFFDFAPDMKGSLFSQVLSQKKAKNVPDLRGIQDRLLPSVKTFRGALVCPICFEEEVLGLIFLVSSSINAYSAEQESLLTLLSNQFAVTLKNILLYQKTAVMAITDSLTGLYTHGYFQDQLIKQITDHKYQNKPLSVIILDVDHFKVVNDNYGHPQGDYILSQMAGLIKNNVRPQDLVCRYGGDEFVLIALGLDRISSSVYAERVRKSVEDYVFVVGGKTAKITISAGVSSFPESAQTAKDLIECSDKALYEAKHRGRNRVVYV